MARFVDKMLSMVGFDSGMEEEYEDTYENEIEDEYDEPVYNRLSDRRSSRVVKLHNSSAQMRVVVMQPESFEEGPAIANHLKNKKPVVLNLEAVDKNDARRIVDFLSGAVYALDGSIRKVSNGIFLVAPNNVDVMSEDIKEEAKASLRWN